METFIVTKIDNQGNRMLLYGHPKWSDYFVIAKPDEKVSVGDKIEYKPEGYNFGWFVRVIDLITTNGKYPTEGKDVLIKTNDNRVLCARFYIDEDREEFFQVFAVGGGLTSVSASRIVTWVYADFAFQQSVGAF